MFWESHMLKGMIGVRFEPGASWLTGQFTWYSINRCLQLVSADWNPWWVTRSKTWRLIRHMRIVCSDVELWLKFIHSQHFLCVVGEWMRSSTPDLVKALCIGGETGRIMWSWCILNQTIWSILPSIGCFEWQQLSEVSSRDWSSSKCITEIHEIKMPGIRTLYIQWMCSTT